MKFSWMFLLVFFLNFTPKDSSDVNNVQFRKDDFSKFQKEAKSVKFPYFVYFSSEKCTPCKRLAKYTFNDYRVARYANENFMAYKADVEYFDSMDIAEKYGVSVYPTIIFFNAKGRRIGTVEGYKDAGKFYQLLEKYAKR